jgi:hypothetical protein
MAPGYPSPRWSMSSMPRRAMDGGRWDTSSLLARLNRESASWIDG